MDDAQLDTGAFPICLFANSVRGRAGWIEVLFLRTNELTSSADLGGSSNDFFDTKKAEVE